MENQIKDEDLQKYINVNKLNISIFKLEEAKEFLKDYDITLVKILGHGSFGIVFEGFDVQNQRKVAVKLILTQNESQINDLMNEAQLARQVNNLYVTKMHDHLYDAKNKNYFIICELCSEGSLLNYFQKNANLQIEQIEDIFRQLIIGLQAIHAKQIIHTDLKPENILLHLEEDGKLIAKICDLGLSKKLQQNITHISTYQGTYAFMPLEQTEGRIQMESDNFALGSIICYLSGINLNDFAVMSKLKLGEFPNCEKHKNSKILSIAFQLMNPVPNKRLSLELALDQLDIHQNKIKIKQVKTSCIINIIQANKRMLIASLALLVVLILAQNIFNQWQLVETEPSLEEVKYQTHEYSYEGQSKKGMKHGNGVLTFQIGDQYIGQFKNNKYHGKGTFKDNKGNEYEGDWKFDKKHGNGIMKFNTGEKYEGEWENDQYHGKGKCFYKNSNEYVGEWKFNKKDGYGVMVYNTKEKYEGYWKNDQKHGKGVMEFNNGEKYDGNWDSDEMIGSGEYTFRDMTISHTHKRSGKIYAL